MDHFKKLKESLKGLINEKTSADDAEKIALVVKDVEKAESESIGLAVKYDEMRNKYVEAVKNSTFGKTGEEAEKVKPVALEDCLKKVLAEE